MRHLKAELLKNPNAVLTKTMWFISLPTEDAHSGHPTEKGVAGFSQHMNDKVAAKIVEIVADNNRFDTSTEPTSSLRSA